MALQFERALDGASLGRIEAVLRAGGADSATVNLTAQTVTVRWRGPLARVGEFAAACAALGHVAHPRLWDAATDDTRRTLRWAFARLGIAGFAAGNVMLVSVGLYAGYFYGIEPKFKLLLEWLAGGFALPAVALGGWPFLRGAWAELHRGRFAMDSLIAAAMLVVFGYSAVALLTGAGHTYFDSVTMFVFLLLIGRNLELVAHGRSGDIAGRLMSLQGRWANRLEGEVPRRVPVHEVAAGDRLLVRQGEAVPADGPLLSGQAQIDQQALTGESAPRAVSAGDVVLAGTVAAAGQFVMRARGGAADTTLGRIVRMTREAAQAAPDLQRLGDRLAGRFAAAVLAVALGTLALRLLVAGGGGQAWIAAMSVLVMACPCAFGLATPVAFLSGARLAGARGVLVKRGTALEHAARLSDVVLDKTGTLTRGTPQVVTLRTAAGATHPPGELDAAPDWLPLLAAAEAWAVHPLAGALARHLERHGAAPPVAAREQGGGDSLSGRESLEPDVENVRIVPGMGLSAGVRGRSLLAGSMGFLAQAGIAVPPVTAGASAAAPGERNRSPARAVPTDGLARTMVHVALDGAYAGSVELADVLRDDAAAAVGALRKLGLRTHVLSGDAEPAVLAVAQAVGADTWRAGMLPQHKVDYVRDLQARGARVAVLGDGINDAPALVQAELGVAVSNASDIALDAAGVVLMAPGVDGLLRTIDVGRRTYSIIRQNFAISIIFNATAIPLAATGLIHPLLAALFMAGSSLAVVLNAARLARTHATR
ncbi:MAG: cation-translocating P-type ATPase [Candidatus Lambdaproteobacteria bacterium]|nr:cation-translocating P-type ATPase [Candidatus Lambdaproteobacteria bacterium]